MFDLLAREIGAGDAGAMLWRRLHGGEALGVAFEQAHRVGIRAISVAIDFGATDAAAWDDYFGELARAAARNRQIAFNVYVAARTRAPAGAMALEVAPADGEERILAAWRERAGSWTRPPSRHCTMASTSAASSRGDLSVRSAGDRNAPRPGR